MRAAPLVSGGGQLIYTTSSVLQEENEEIVAAFLRQFKSEFQLVSAKSVWERAVPGVPWPFAAQTDFVKMLPSHQIGSVFVAVLERKT